MPQHPPAANLAEAAAIAAAAARLRRRRRRSGGLETSPADAQLLLQLVDRLMQNPPRRRLRPTPSPMSAEGGLGADEDSRIDELERQLLSTSRNLQALTQRHHAAARSHEQQSARQVKEIERLQTQVDHLQAQTVHPNPALRGSSLHSRFARHRAHPLVEDALGPARLNSTQQELTMDAPLFTRTNFQPSFEPRPDASYDITDFLALHDRNFVRAAYVAVLRREPDPEGAESYVALVRAGEPKAKLLKELLLSEEGRRHSTVIRGLDAQLRVLRWCELPVVGRLLAAVLFLVTVNTHLRELRVLENHVIRIAEESQAVHEANLSKLRSISK